MINNTKNTKQIIYSTDARNKLLDGVTKIASAVKATLGARGRNVIIQNKAGSPIVTKDGVTVAKEIRLKDPIENLGAQMVCESATKTNDGAGDGTTTATVLAEEIYRQGVKLVTAGSNPIDLKRGIDKATAQVIIQLKEMSIPVEDRQTVARVATISANGDTTIGNLIADAMEHVGRDGVITVEDANSTEDSLEIVEGLEINKGYTSPYFITDPNKMIVELENPYIFLYNSKLLESDINILVENVLSRVLEGGKSILIVADDYDDQLISLLGVNKLKAGLKICAIRADGYGDRKREMMEDIAIVTGGVMISPERGDKLEDVTLEVLGRSDKVVVRQTSSIVIGGKGDAEDIEKRIDSISELIEETENQFDREKLHERRAKIKGGVAILKIGGLSEVEMKEKKDRVEDALHASKASVQEGVVVGGGVALLRCSVGLSERVETLNDDERLGVEIIKRSIQSPIKTIMQNGGQSGDVVIANILSDLNLNWGFNIQTEVYEDLFESGVIDPVKVTRTALENASSIASLLLTTEVVIHDDEIETQKEN
jgi:chaperonin GroEL